MYLTPSEARTRLQERYGIETTVYIGDLIMASEELRSRAPFVEGVDLSDPPDSLLDWVALCAYELGNYEQPVSSVGAGDVSLSYRDSPTRNQRRLQRLLAPYLAVRGRVS